jgi:anti-anti-sigma factor
MSTQLQDVVCKYGHRINAGLMISSQLKEEAGLLAMLDGQLKQDATGPLQDYFAGQLERHQTGNLILNCKGVSFVDSQGLALLLILHRLCQSHGGGLTIQAPPANLRELLKLTRFDTMIKVVA